MPQQNKLSSIWDIDLFERRQFRNGSDEAQCMECGQSFNTSELGAMTAHIVQKHSQYAAKLLAKQLGFGDHHSQQPGNTMPKVEEQFPVPNSASSLAATGIANTKNNNGIENEALTGTEEEEGSLCHSRGYGTETPFSTIGPSSPSVSISNFEGGEDIPIGDLPNQNESFARVPSPATPPPLAPSAQSKDIPFGANSEHFRVPPPATPPLSSSVLTTNTTAAEDSSNCSAIFSMATTPKADAIDNENSANCYLDRFGKEWRLLVEATDDAKQLDQIAGEHCLNRKGPTKNDGRIYFNCRFSLQKCAFRGLYLPVRQALFCRRTHNHPTPSIVSSSTTAVMPTSPGLEIHKDKVPDGILQSETPKSMQCQQNYARCSNEDIVAAFSAALPDFDNSENGSVAADCKDHIKKIDGGDDKTPNAAPSPYFDKFGRPWHWLFSVVNINEDPERIRQFCQAHFLLKAKMSPRQTVFVCKFNRRSSTRAIVRCPYRAVFVAERCAMFALQSHNHPPPDEEGNDTAANEAAGCFLPCRPQQQLQQGFASSPTINPNDSSTLIDTNDDKDKEKAPPVVPSPPIDSLMDKSAQKIGDNTEDHFDSVCRAWKFLAKIDLGQCEKYGERTQLRNFCRQHGLCRRAMKRYADGTLRAHSLACREWHSIYKCPYRAIYVVDRRAIFDRNMHNHAALPPTEKTESLPKKIRVLPSPLGISDKAMPYKSPFASHPPTLDHFLLNLSEQFSSMAKHQKTTLPIGTERNGENAFSAVASSNSANPIDECADYVDSHDKSWKLEAKINAGNCETYEQRKHLHKFCSEYGLSRLTIRRNADGTLRVYSMACKELRNCVKCPFRAVYVVDRGAVFVRGFHDHSIVEKKQMRQKKAMFFKPNWAKKRAVATFDIAKAIATTTENNICPLFSVNSPMTNAADQTLLLNASPPAVADQFDEKQNFGIEKCDENANASSSAASFITASSNSNQNGDKSFANEVVAVENEAGAGDDHSDYLDCFGKAWKWLMHFDVGECSTDEQRALIRDFCSEHGLYRGHMRWKTNGTFRALAFTCKELRHKNYNCKYRAIYVVKRRAIFERDSHDHTIKMKRKRPLLRGRKIKGKEPTNIGTTGEGTSAQQQNCSLELKAKADGNYLDISVLSSLDQKAPPPVVADHFGNLWHWFADLSDTDRGTVMGQISRQHYLNRACQFGNGTRVHYRCRYHKPPFYCRFKLLHVPAKNVLYHRMSHNHPMPLSTDKRPHNQWKGKRGQQRKKQKVKRRSSSSGIDDGAGDQSVAIKTSSIATSEGESRGG
ncbi:hypothetical protein niasHS_013050 [Heterodera schachtii]|uniref:Uncharacterized protein n=1 Tax=Heterodera schachtii TaxID=97005 RepID=A0ABD2IFN3_HETSC